MKGWLNWISADLGHLMSLRANRSNGKLPVAVATATEIRLFPKGVMGPAVSMAEIEAQPAHAKKLPRKWVLELDRSFGLRRETASLRLPDQAQQSMAQMDVKLGTPLDLRDIYIFPAVLNDTDRTSSYMAIKRNRLAEIIAKMRNLRLRPVQIKMRASASVYQANAGTLAELALWPRWRTPLNRGLSIIFLCAFLIGIGTMGHMFYRQKNAMAQLDAKLLEARIQAKEVSGRLKQRKRRIKQIESLQQDRFQRASVVSILEELSRLIPDSAWLSNVNIANDSVVISGFANSAPELVVTLDGSALFKDPALSGRVLRDAGTGSDRFSIAMKLKGAQQ